MPSMMCLYRTSTCRMERIIISRGLYLLFSQWSRHLRIRLRRTFFIMSKTLQHRHKVLNACNVLPMIVAALPLARRIIAKSVLIKEISVYTAFHQWLSSTVYYIQLSLSCCEMSADANRCRRGQFGVVHFFVV